MTTGEATLHAGGPEDLTDCSRFLTRLVRLEPAGLVRLQQADARVTCWAQPLGVVVRREVRAQMSVGDRTVSAAELLAVLDPPPVGAVRLPARRDELWRVTLPPRAGWSVLDVIPVEALRGVVGRAGRVVRAAGDPTAAGESLLDQESLRVSHGTDEVVLPVRVVVVLERMGFLDGDGRSADVVRVACTPAWIRVAARHGTAYQRRAGRGLSLF